MLAELAAIINAIFSAARVPLARKERQLIDKKIEEASHIIQKASPDDIQRYDEKLKKLIAEIKNNLSGGSLPDALTAVHRVLDEIIK